MSTKADIGHVILNVRLSGRMFVPRPASEIGLYPAVRPRRHIVYEPQAKTA